MQITHLLYLHGFRSSPQSTKARLMEARVQSDFPRLHWWCPQLPPSPRQVSELITQGTADWPSHSMAVIGSSLGGFYATWLAEQRGCKAVVLNPSVDPARSLAAYIGEQTSWHDPTERFFFRPEYVDELRALYAGSLKQPDQYMAIIAQGDELLDWREMSARYAGTRLQVLEGGDHALSDFPQYLDGVLDFLDPVNDRAS